MKTIIYLILILSSASLTNCASIEYINEDGSTSRGIKTYPTKPYLLVEKSAIVKEKGSESVIEKQIKVTLVSLPDLENPVYIKEKSGLGNTELNITLENGIITTYGSKSDSKIPETITSVAGLLTSVAGFSTKLDTEEELPSFTLFELIMINNKLELEEVKIK